MTSITKMQNYGPATLTAHEELNIYHYASTPTGRQELEEMRDKADDRDNFDEVALLNSSLRRGADLRAANREAKRQMHPSAHSVYSVRAVYLADNGRTHEWCGTVTGDEGLANLFINANPVELDVAVNKRQDDGQYKMVPVNNAEVMGRADEAKAEAKEDNRLVSSIQTYGVLFNDWHGKTYSFHADSAKKARALIDSFENPKSIVVSEQIHGFADATGERRTDYRVMDSKEVQKLGSGKRA
jgi:hypothetical protein